MNGIQENQRSEFAPDVIVLIGIGKKCGKCGEIKDYNAYHKNKFRFDGLQRECKECTKKYRAIYCCTPLRRTKHAEYVRKWRLENINRTKAATRRATIAKRSTPKGRLITSMAVGILKTLKYGSKKRRHWEVLVGYSVDELKTHLEKQFTSGMTWENYGTYWHIDHVIPKVVFNFETPEDIDFKKCWALKNLRPLEAKKNLSKHSKLETPFQPSLCI